jgi:hypothetical protein
MVYPRSLFIILKRTNVERIIPISNRIYPYGKRFSHFVYYIPIIPITKLSKPTPSFKLPNIAVPWYSYPPLLSESPLIQPGKTASATGEPPQIRTPETTQKISPRDGADGHYHINASA